MVNIRGPLETRGATRCPGGVSVYVANSNLDGYLRAKTAGTSDVDRQYLESVTITAQQDWGIITLNSTFGLTFSTFKTTLFGEGSLMRVHYPKCAYGPYC